MDVKRVAPRPIKLTAAWGCGGASTGSPSHTITNLLKRLERAKGFEPSTPTLARLCSTPELRPLWRRPVKPRAGKERGH